GERRFSKFSQNPVTVFFKILKKTVRPEQAAGRVEGSPLQVKFKGHLQKNQMNHIKKSCLNIVQAGFFTWIYNAIYYDKSTSICPKD
ncbi:MAG: hypothetical protein JWQ10_3871, partial [Herbaspirillum sp.]|nr:hypothetical protein [Herbaspirillum sp.]